MCAQCDPSVAVRQEEDESLSPLFAFNETAAEIIAVAVFYAISYLLERRRKKNAPPEGEEGPLIPELPEDLFEPTPVQKSSVPQKVDPPEPSEEPAAPAATVEPRVKLEPELRALAAYSLEVAQDLGRARSIRSVVKNLDPAVRRELTAIREHLQRHQESGVPADEQLHWGFDRIQTLRSTLSRFHHHGLERLQSDARFLRYDALVQMISQPFAAVFRQRTEQGAYANLHAVPETLPVKSLGQLMPEVGWIQIPMNDPTSVLELVQRTIEKSIVLHPHLHEEILDALPGTRGAGTIETDGTLRKSGVRNWIAHWSDTLFTDALATLYLGPEYGNALQTAGRLRPENWERFDVPRGSKSSQPPGEIRLLWIQRILDQFSMEPLKDQEREEEVLLRWGSAVTDMEIHIFEDALEQAFLVFLESPFASLGDVPIHRVTGWELTGTQKRQAKETWESSASHPKWSAERTFLLCALRALATSPAEGKRWVDGIEGVALRGVSGRMETDEPVADWLTEAIRDQVIFGRPEPWEAGSSGWRASSTLVSRSLAVIDSGLFNNESNLACNCDHLGQEKPGERMEFLG